MGEIFGVNCFHLDLHAKRADGRTEGMLFWIGTNCENRKKRIAHVFIDQPAMSLND